MKETIAEFCALDRRRRELEDELEEIKRRRASLESMLLENFHDLGLQNMNVDGMTLYIRTNQYATKRSDVTMEQVCQVIRRLGRSDMVSEGYHPSSLKSWVKELLENGEVPGELSEVLNIGETYSLQTRKA